VFAFFLWLACPMLPMSLDCPFCILSLSYDLCAQCCQCLWIAPSVFCVCPMTCVPNVVNVSRLPLLYSVFALWLACPMLPMSLDCPFCILCLPYDLRAQCCQCLWIAPSVFSNIYLVIQIRISWLSINWLIIFV
jgi:hypothetical protein